MKVESDSQRTGRISEQRSNIVLGLYFNQFRIRRSPTFRLDRSKLACEEEAGMFVKWPGSAARESAAREQDAERSERRNVSGERRPTRENVVNNRKSVRCGPSARLEC